MTLSQIITKIEDTASKQPAVNCLVRDDIFKLNSRSDAKYGVFAWTQGQHSSSVDSDFITYQFTLFYVDRLTNYKGNLLEVQSVGISTLENIIRTLDADGIASGNVNYTTFSQRFLDECAGVFANVSFEVPVASTCEESFTAARSILVIE